MCDPIKFINLMDMPCSINIFFFILQFAGNIVVRVLIYVQVSYSMLSVKK